MAAKKKIIPTEINFQGRRYVRVRAASMLIGYSYHRVMDLIEMGKIRVYREGRRVYACYSDLQAYRDKMNAKKSQFKLMADWWKANPGKHKRVKNSRVFMTLLEKEGIRVHRTSAQHFLRKYQPFFMARKAIVKWLLENPERRQMETSLVRKLLVEELRIEISISGIWMAFYQFDELKDGYQGEPFDREMWVTVREAKDFFKISDGILRDFCRKNGVQKRYWRHRVYLFKPQLCELRRVREWKHGAKYAALREFIQGKPECWQMTALKVRDVFWRETGIVISKSAIHAVKKQMGAVHGIQ